MDTAWYTHHRVEVPDNRRSAWDAYNLFSDDSSPRACPQLKGAPQAGANLGSEHAEIEVRISLSRTRRMRELQLSQEPRHGHDHPRQADQPSNIIMVHPASELISGA